MPSMEEIYQAYAIEYDALVAHEDWENRLESALLNLAAWDGAVVVESGMGTGRVSSYYLERASFLFGFDNSAHMLKRARMNLATWETRMELGVASHTALPVHADTADLFVEGWAFGHAVRAGESGPESTVEELIREVERVCRPGASAMLIETLGTNVDSPSPPHETLAEFYDLLETKHGFTRHTVSTDYRFDTAEEAVRLCGFFFGETMRAALRQRFADLDPSAEGAIVPEFTGIWHRTR
jgi:ubiquinone/menaquinone biosynthesis C-methylase UbiE